MSKTIGILGCGWLGLPLAVSLVESGCEVRGSTTSDKKIPELQALGIKPFLIRLYENRIEGDEDVFLSGVSILIINVPPKLRKNNKENYGRKMKLLHRSIKRSNVRKVIFVSSTSVYGDIGGVITEATPTHPNTESGKQLTATERLFQNDTDLESTIVRFGGLIGPNRHPVYHLAGRKELQNGNDPVNLIHLEDCIRILKTIIEENYWGEVFNGVYPHHPTKKDYYHTEAQQRGLIPPEYDLTSTSNGKFIHSKNLITVKNFVFQNYIGS